MSLVIYTATEVRYSFTKEHETVQSMHGKAKRAKREATQRPSFGKVNVMKPCLAFMTCKLPH
ncbi:hypothetical protein PanWU01x14_010880 [Parasponia andersonii]|uniref:Ribosomal protein n=1 Tax=Parasponia andersonii TaxID=3476 RepID=A0A2P5E1E2_PARAD|nr:hypothetical protein PanWU01x14_010880 [Parasponia andersonii]